MIRNALPFMLVCCSLLGSLGYAQKAPIESEISFKVQIMRKKTEEGGGAALLTLTFVFRSLSGREGRMSFFFHPRLQQQKRIHFGDILK